MEAWKRLTGLFTEALWPRRTLCLCCGRPLTEGRCRFCHGEGTVRTRSRWAHEGVPRLLVHRLKFDGVTDAAELLADGVAQTAALLPK